MRKPWLEDLRRLLGKKVLRGNSLRLLSVGSQL
jgi:hypothetical protein